MQTEVTSNFVFSGVVWKYIGKWDLTKTSYLHFYSSILLESIQKCSDIKIYFVGRYSQKHTGRGKFTSPSPSPPGIGLTYFP
jgi:hypothetical protein